MRLAQRHRPQWSIDDVAAHIDVIRSTDNPVILPVVPAGLLALLRYSFERVKRGGLARPIHERRAMG